MFEQDIRLGPGTGTTTSHTLEILIMLTVAGLLGLWLGWILWSRYKQEAEKLRLDNASLTATAEALRIELAAAKSTLASAQAENANLISQISSLNRNNANLRDRMTELEEALNVTQSRNRVVETELGLSYDPDTVIADDIPLEIIEQQHEADHAAHYGEDMVEETILEPVAPPMMEADFVPVAPLVMKSDFVPAAPVEGVELEGFRVEGAVPMGMVHIEVQDEPQVVAPAPPPATTKTRSSKAKASAVAVADMEAPAAVVSTTPDDLTVVEGIGPKIQMLLNQYGIYTYQDLAETEVSRLKEILQGAGPQLAMHDPGTWPSQANLAANDQWDALKSIQGFLKGGKKPS